MQSDGLSRPTMSNNMQIAQPRRQKYISYLIEIDKTRYIFVSFQFTPRTAHLQPRLQAALRPFVQKEDETGRVSEMGGLCYRAA